MVPLFSSPIQTPTREYAPMRPSLWKTMSLTMPEPLDERTIGANAWIASLPPAPWPLVAELIPSPIILRP